MKPILIIVALVAMAYTPSWAQKIEIGMNYGGNYGATLYSKGKVEVQDAYKYVKTSPALNFKASYNNDKWQVGGIVGFGSISGRYYQHWTCILYAAPTTQEEADAIERDRYEMENPRYRIKYIPYMAFVNRKVNAGRVTMYGGVSFGGSKILKAEGGQSDITDGHHGLHVDYFGGAQAGCRYAIGEHLGINTELSANYMNLANNLYVVSFPVTAGMSYSF